MAIAEKPPATTGTTVPVKTAAPAPTRPAVQRHRGPLDLFDSLQDEMERLWQTARPSWMGWPFRSLTPLTLRPLAPGTAWAPRTDVFVQDGSLVFKAELPGMKKEDIHVSLEGTELDISGESREETEIKDEDYYRCERRYGSFHRRFEVPAGTEPGQIAATYADGVLEVRIPAPSEQKSKATEIPIG